MEAFHFQNTAFTGFPFSTDDLHVSTRLQLATGNTANADNTHIAVVIQCGNLHLERTIHVHLRRRYVIHDHLQQRAHVTGQIIRRMTGNTVQTRRVNHREVELLFGSAQTVKQIENFIQNPIRTRARTVYFVNNHNRTQTTLERFLGYETGLWHRAVLRVHQQTHRVHHRHDAFHFTAEVGVSGSIHDVDAVVVPADGGVFRQNGNAALFLLVVGVHDAFATLLTTVQSTGLLQQFINQGRFPVVNVGDDGNISEIIDHREGLGESLNKNGGRLYLKDRHCVTGKCKNRRISLRQPARRKPPRRRCFCASHHVLDAPREPIMCRLALTGVLNRLKCTILVPLVRVVIHDGAFISAHVLRQP